MNFYQNHIINPEVTESRSPEITEVFCEIFSNRGGFKGAAVHKNPY